MSKSTGFRYTGAVKIYQVLVLCAAALAGISCDTPQSGGGVPLRGDFLEPEPGEGIYLATAESSRVAIQAESEAVSPLVAVPDEMLVIATINANLDLDNSEEQIIVVKRRDDPSDRIRLLIADFDELRGQYRLTWEGVTSATNIRSFSVFTSDLVGDHQDEIVAVGTDSSGNQTMDVFRRAGGTMMMTGLQFRRIFSATTDGTIEIEEQQRGTAYRTLQSPGESHHIVAYRRRTDAENPLDLIRTVYRWQNRTEQFEALEVEEIAGERLEQAQLRELYAGDANLLERFLQGPWFRTTGEQIGDGLEMAFFDPTGQELSLFRGDAQERYEWLNSYKTLYEGGPGLWINARNLVLRTVRKQMSITVLNLDTIRLSVEGAEYWNGTYQRMSAGIQGSVLRRYDVARPDFLLNGVYRNETHEELVFEEPFFRFRADGIDWRGGFHLIHFQYPILELKVVDARQGDRLPGDGRPDNIPENSQGTFSVRFRVDYQEQRSEDRIVRRLVLHPVVLSVHGIRETGGTTFVLEQVEEFLLPG